MARPIGLEVAPRDPREELRKRLEQAPDQHAEALLESYELLQQLHDHGVLRLLRGALSSGDMLLETAVNAAKSEEAIRGLRNVITLARVLGSIDPEMLRRMVDGLPAAAEQVPEEPPSLFQIFRRLSSRNVRRVLAAATNVLESAGRGPDPRSR